jgi:tRNA threonylcarbamoyladenosine biosynthesis protein TsaB
MNILALDSTAEVCTVALCSDERLVAEMTVNTGNTHSQTLLPIVEQVLKITETSLDDVDLFACSTGPGSFTGVRIGAALVMGLAFGKGIPCCGVSTLEALAENLRGLKGLIVPVMDARRGQYYTALFRYDGTMTRLTQDEALSAEALAEKIKQHTNGAPVYLVGDGYCNAYAALAALGINAEQTPELLILENAASIGKVAYQKQKNGQAITDSELSATYLRLPQAERERLERLGKNTK